MGSSGRDKQSLFVGDEGENMCEWGTDVNVEINGTPKAIDSCIAPIVDALNRGGIATIGSCCGHGKSGSILLADGRELLIPPSEPPQLTEESLELQRLTTVASD